MTEKQRGNAKSHCRLLKCTADEEAENPPRMGVACKNDETAMKVCSNLAKGGGGTDSSLPPFILFIFLHGLVSSAAVDYIYNSRFWSRNCEHWPPTMSRTVRHHFRPVIYINIFSVRTLSSFSVKLSCHVLSTAYFKY